MFLLNSRIPLVRFSSESMFHYTGPADENFHKRSDDMFGRTQIYQAIIKGDPIKDPGLPESFNVVRKELNALCIDVEMLTQDQLDPESMQEDPTAFSLDA